VVDRDLVTRKIALILEDLRQATAIGRKALRDVPEYLRRVHDYLTRASAD